MSDYREILKLGRLSETVEVEFDMGQLMDFIAYDSARIEYALAWLKLHTNRTGASRMVEMFTAMDGLERDEFLRQIQPLIDTQTITRAP